MKAENTIHDTFRLAMFPSLIMGLLANAYIAVILCYTGMFLTLFSPIIGSALFAVCYMLLRRDRMTAKLAFLLTTCAVVVEITIHTFLLGWDCGFFYFMFLLPMVFLLNALWKRWMVFFFNGSMILWFFVMRYFLLERSAIYEISTEFIATINLLNALAVGMVVAVILVFFRRTIYAKDEMLTDVNTELERQNKEIKEQHSHLQILLKEVHHRVKNNLQIISSLMSLQSRTVKDSQTVTILNESRRRVEAIALIHQRLYQGDNANQINFKSYLDELMASQQTMYPHVVYSVMSEEVILTLDTAVPLGLIISEMITNSIKHAFEGTENPSISMQLKKQSSEFELLVHDNGCGLSEDFSLDNPVSLGTEIIMSLVDQIDAKIENTNDDGAKFTISFRDQSAS